MTAIASEPAHALFSTMDTGEVVSQGSFKASVEPQYALGNDEGLNVTGRFDTGFNESIGMRALIGTGKIPLEWGLLFKWVPVPDIHAQPAIGGLFGLVMTRDHDVNRYHFRFHPLVSKAFDSKVGTITPYAALPVGISVDQNGSSYPVQLALGAEFKKEEWNEFRLMIEGGTNIANAFSYISASLGFFFDGKAK